MIVPEFMRFYHYKASEVLGEFAVTFFALLNQMPRLKAEDALTDINTTATAMAGKDGQASIDAYREQARGIHGVLEEVNIAKAVRK